MQNTTVNTDGREATHDPFPQTRALGEGIAHLTVDMVEELGADTLVHGRLGDDDGDFTVRLRGGQRIAPGDVLPLEVTPEQLHLFDPETGKRIGDG